MLWIECLVHAVNLLKIGYLWAYIQISIKEEEKQTFLTVLCSIDWSLPLVMECNHMARFMRKRHSGHVRLAQI